MCQEGRGALESPPPWAVRAQERLPGRGGGLEPGFRSHCKCVPRPTRRSLELWCTTCLEPRSSEIRSSRNASASATQPFLGGPSAPLSPAGLRPPPAPPDGPSPQTDAGCARASRPPGHGAEGLVWPPEAGDQEGHCQAGVSSSPGVAQRPNKPSSPHRLLLSCTCAQRLLQVSSLVRVGGRRFHNHQGELCTPLNLAPILSSPPGASCCPAEPRAREQAGGLGGSLGGTTPPAQGTLGLSVWGVLLSSSK